VVFGYIEAATFLAHLFCAWQLKMGIGNTTVGADQENTSRLHDMTEAEKNQTQGLLCIPTCW
jgi:hypothetical protein